MDHQKKIESLVDDVVRGYHGALNGYPRRIAGSRLPSACPPARRPLSCLYYRSAFHHPAEPCTAPPLAPRRAGGFSKAIRNYSRILGLFEESSSLAASTEGDLRSSLEFFSSRSGSLQLQLQWQQSLKLAETVKLLDRVQRVKGVRERVAEKVAKRQFLDAVQGGCPSLKTPPLTPQPSHTGLTSRVRGPLRRRPGQRHQAAEGRRRSADDRRAH